jgi:lysophospholipase L1-like esterase
VFPRGVSAEDPLRQVIVAINNLVRTYADNQQVFFLDLSQIFLDNQGRLSRDLMPDYLHPNEEGYQVWADGMEDMLTRLWGEHQRRGKVKG